MYGFNSPASVVNAASSISTRLSTASSAIDAAASAWLHTRTGTSAFLSCSIS